MLRNFTAALIATTLVAGSAFAAQPSATTAAPAATPAAASTQNAVKPVTAPATSSAQAVAKPADTAKSVKVAKHVRKPLRRHTAHVVKPGTAKNVKASA
jgi:hypothetical protein